MEVVEDAFSWTYIEIMRANTVQEPKGRCFRKYGVFTFTSVSLLVMDATVCLDLCYATSL